MRAVSGKGELKYCPKRKKVWNTWTNSSTTETILYIYSNIPSYGLKKIIAPTKYKERVV